MKSILKSESKQIRLWLPNELFAAISEQKFKEKNVDEDLRDYAMTLLKEGLQSRKIKSKSV